MPEAFRMGNVVVPGADRDHRSRIRKPFVKPLNLNELISWIKKQNWDEYVKQELIKRASAYPCNGLWHFANNINTQVVKICEDKQQLRKEKDERERTAAAESRTPGDSSSPRGPDATQEEKGESDPNPSSLPSEELL
jgi:hypothetical protein